MDAKTEYDASALSDTEREELIAQALRSGNLPRRGRPRKGGTQLRWADLGLDRRRVFEWKRMSKIPQADFDAFFDAQRRAGGKLSHRAILVYFHLINVRSADVFEGTEIGELAEALLRPVERFFEEQREITRQGRYAVLHALRYRLRAIADKAALDGEP